MCLCSLCVSSSFLCCGCTVTRKFKVIQGCGNELVTRKQPEGSVRVKTVRKAVSAK